MQKELMQYRDWECLKLCQTRENCLAACGLMPPDDEKKPVAPERQAEFTTPPVMFIISPKRHLTKVTAN